MKDIYQKRCVRLCINCMNCSPSPLLLTGPCKYWPLHLLTNFINFNHRSRVPAHINSRRWNMGADKITNDIHSNALFKVSLKRVYPDKVLLMSRIIVNVIRFGVVYDVRIMRLFMAWMACLAAIRFFQVSSMFVDHAMDATSVNDFMKTTVFTFE